MQPSNFSLEPVPLCTSIVRLGSVADGLYVCVYGADPPDVVTEPTAAFISMPRPLYVSGVSIVPPAISKPSNVLTANAADDCERCVVLSRS